MKTPQEKKRLSYAKDRRNTYGENSKGSRKSIRKNKAAGIRSERRAQDQSLAIARNALDAETLTSAESAVRSTKPRVWKKSPDRPLSEVVPQKLAQREFRIGSKIARRKRSNAA